MFLLNTECADNKLRTVKQFYGGTVPGKNCNGIVPDRLYATELIFQLIFTTAGTRKLVINSQIFMTLAIRVIMPLYPTVNQLRATNYLVFVF